MKIPVYIKDEEYLFTDKEFRFANYYLGEARFNATEAAKLAGFSENTARQQGSRMLSNVNIENFIKWKASEMLELLGITQERVLREVAAIAFTDVTEFFNNDWTLKPMNEIPREKLGAMEIKITEGSRIEGKTKSISSNLNCKVKALMILWDLVKDNPD